MISPFTEQFKVTSEADVDLRGHIRLATPQKSHSTYAAENELIIPIRNEDKTALYYINVGPDADFFFLSRIQHITGQQNSVLEILLTRQQRPLTPSLSSIWSLESLEIYGTCRRKVHLSYGGTYSITVQTTVQNCSSVCCPTTRLHNPSGFNGPNCGCWLPWLPALSLPQSSPQHYHQARCRPSCAII